MSDNKNTNNAINITVNANQPPLPPPPPTPPTNKSSESNEDEDGDHKMNTEENDDEVTDNADNPDMNNDNDEQIGGVEMTHKYVDGRGFSCELQGWNVRDITVGFHKKSIGYTKDWSFQIGMCFVWCVYMVLFVHDLICVWYDMMWFVCGLICIWYDMIWYVGNLFDKADDAWQGVSAKRKKDFVTDWKKLWREDGQRFSLTRRPKVTKEIKYLYRILNELLEFKAIHTDCPPGPEGMWSAFNL